MTTIDADSGIAVPIPGPSVPGRHRFAARLLLPLLLLACANLVANSVYFTVSVWLDAIVDEVDSGPPGLEIYLFIAIPVVIQAALYAYLMVPGFRHRARLGEGDIPSRRKIRALSYSCATGLGVALIWTGTLLSWSDGENGPGSIEPNLILESMGSGELSWLGWLGLASFAATAVLFAGSIAMAFLTEPRRRGATASASYGDEDHELV